MDMNYALVTGAGSRLGFAIAHHLLSSGYDVIAHFNNSERGINKLQELAGRSERKVFPIKADLSDKPGIEGAISDLQALVAEDRIALVVHSAAVMLSAPVTDLSYEHISRLEHINFIAPTMITSALCSNLATESNVIMISDIAADQLWNKYPIYAITKSQLDNVARHFAKSLAPKTRVNTIALGLVLRSENESEQTWEKRIDRTPMKRATTLSELTDAIDLILKSGSMTGCRIILDSGTSLL